MVNCIAHTNGFYSRNSRKLVRYAQSITLTPQLSPVSIMCQFAHDPVLRRTSKLREQREDQAEAISVHTLKGIEFFDRFGNFAKERAAIEEEYAAKIKALVKKNTGKKKEDEDAKPFSYMKAFTSMLKEMESLASQHEMIAEKVRKEVLPFVAHRTQAHRQSRKQCLGDLSQLHQNLNAAIEHHFKQQKAYGKTFKEAEAAYLKYFKAEKNMEISRLDLEKAKNNAQTRSYVCEQAKAAYSSALDAANEAQKQHYATHLPRILERMRMLDEERIEDTKQAMDLFIRSDKGVTPVINRCHEDMLAAINQIDKGKDSLVVIESFRTGYKYPTSMPFEDLGRPEEILTSGPNGEPGETTLKRGILGTAPKKDSKSVTRKTSMHHKFFGGGEKNKNESDYGSLPPQQRARRLQQKLNELEASLGKASQAHDGLIRMQATYKENSRLGNPSDCDSQISQYAKEIESIKVQMSKYSVLLTATNSELGGADTPISIRSADSASNSIQSHSSFDNSTRPNPPASQTIQRSSYSSGDSVSSEGSKTNGHAPTCREEVYEEPALGTCIAMFPFEGSTDGTIKLVEGEEFLLLEKDEGDGWTRVRKLDGSSEGFVPTSYLQCRYYPE